MSNTRWSEVALGNLCSLVNGRAFRRSEWSPSGLPIVRIQNLNDPGKPFNFYDGELEEQFQIDSGTPLIAWSGTPGTSFGAYLWERGKAALNQHIFRVNVDEARCDKKYLIYAVNFKLREWIAKAKGSVGLRHINKSELQKLSIPLPFPNEPTRSLEFQRLIVNRLESQLGQVKEAKALVAAMQQDARRLVAVSVESVLRQVEPVSQVTCLGNVARAVNGFATGEGDSPIRVFKTKHVYPHHLLMDRPSYMRSTQIGRLKQDDERRLRSGDVLMANTAEGTLGRVTFVEYSGDNWTIDTKVTLIRSKNPREVLAKWIYYYLWSGRGQSEIQRRKKGVSFGEKRGQTGISAKSIEEVPVLLPPFDHQRRVVAHLDRIRDESERLNAHLKGDATMIVQAEQAIIAQAFSSGGARS